VHVSSLTFFEIPCEQTAKNYGLSFAAPRTYRLSVFSSCFHFAANFVNILVRNIL